jgi:hypothetical protein
MLKYQKRIVIIKPNITRIGCIVSRKEGTTIRAIHICAMS